MHQEDIYKAIEVLIKAAIIADRESLPPHNSLSKKSRRRDPEELQSCFPPLSAEEALQRQVDKFEERAAKLKLKQLKYTNFRQACEINEHDEEIEKLNGKLKNMNYAVEDVRTSLRDRDNHLEIANHEVDSSKNNLKTNRTQTDELITELASKRAELQRTLEDINDVRRANQVATPEEQPEAEEEQQEEEEVADKEWQPKQKKRKVSKTQNIEKLPKFVVPFIDKDGARMMTIGAKKSSVSRELFDKLEWHSASRATRGLLTYFFNRKVLGTHSYSGKKSPIYANTDKSPKDRLNSDITDDIIYIVSEICNVSKKEVILNITSKCGDESKLWENQAANKENSTPAGSSSSKMTIDKMNCQNCFYTQNHIQKYWRCLPKACD